MKRHFYLFLLSLFTISAHAQDGWEVLTKTYPNVTLRDVYANGETIIAIGSDIGRFVPVILSSFDGGKTWDTSEVGQGPLLRSIGFHDGGNGIITSVNTRSCILTSDDHGKTWDWDFCDGDSAFNGVNQISFVNKKVGYLAGWGTTSFSDGTVYKTTDGGKNWVNVSGNLPSQPFEFLQFMNENVGYGGAYLFGHSNLYKTSDGGKTWKDLPVADLKFADVYFHDADNGIMACDRAIRKTTDGGQSWTTLQQIGGVSFSDIEFLNDKIAYAVGSRLKGSDNSLLSKIYFSNDGGETWKEEASGIADHVGKVRFFNGRAYAITNKGVVLQSRVLGPANSVDKLEDHNSKMSLFPNPAAGHVSLQLNLGHSKLAEIEIYDLAGNLVWQTQALGSASTEFSIQHLKAGVYTVSATDTEQQLYRRKLVIL